MLNELIPLVIEGSSLTAEQARSAMEQIMSGQATPVGIVAYLTALRMKGESADEIFGSARVMREKAVRVPHNQSILFDNCGTGGDGAGTFNISTTSAFVIAACGLPVGKHGNRSVSSQCGSADLLEALGAKLDLPPEKVGECIDEVGFGFMFAPRMHPAMKEVMPVRRELGIRTIFNILGPLTNPAGATHQLIGVFDSSYLTKLAQAASSLGVKRVGVAHSDAGTDEITTAAGNHLVLADNSELNEIRVSPEEYGFDLCRMEDLAGGDARHNASITRSIFSGEKGARRDTVILNTAVALFIGEKVKGIREGITLATESIDSGKTLELMNRYVEFTNR